MAFREFVLTRKQEYTQAKRVKSKDDIARQIIDEIVNRNGKFLRKIESPAEARKLGVPEERIADVWTKANEAVILEKVKQALREKHSKKDSEGKSGEGTDEEKDEGQVKRRKILKSEDGLIDSGTVQESNPSGQLDKINQLFALLEQQQILRAQKQANAASYLSQQPHTRGNFGNSLPFHSATQSTKPLNAFGLGTNLGPIPNLIVPQSNAPDLLSLIHQQGVESLLSQALLKTSLSSLRLPRNTAGMQTSSASYNSLQSVVAQQDETLAQQLREYLHRTGANNQSNNSASTLDDDRKPKASVTSKNFEQAEKSHNGLVPNPSGEAKASKKSPHNKKRTWGS